ncbi:MAG: hypothetical protein ACTSV3_07155 [Candidatus Thorarchaeota archaeon]|nr:MAG: hypothetical protein DRP09_01035 [Candidatus Thorarchaeota archaeon]
MTQDVVLERAAGRHTLFLVAKEIGRDLLVTVYGGDEHHIGAVTVGHVSKSHYRNTDTTSLSTLTFPGHRDYVLSNSATEQLCRKLNRSVVTTVGIHYENATGEEIQEIIDAVNAMVSDLVAYYQKAE